MKKNSGFTLLELMITLAIIGILLIVGLPSLKTFMQGNQLIASTNELVSALHIARSEAIKLNSRVSICESSNGTTCTATGDWKNGWIVFVDALGAQTGAAAPCVATGTDCLLRVHGAINDNSLTVSGEFDSTGVAINAFTFNPRGIPEQLGTTQSGNFNLCSLNNEGKTIDSRAVILSLSGRVRISADTAVILQCPAAA